MGWADLLTPAGTLDSPGIRGQLGEPDTQALGAPGSARLQTACPPAWISRHLPGLQALENSGCSCTLPRSLSPPSKERREREGNLFLRFSSSSRLIDKLWQMEGTHSPCLPPESRAFQSSLSSSPIVQSSESLRRREILQGPFSVNGKSSKFSAFWRGRKALLSAWLVCLLQLIT